MPTTEPTPNSSESSPRRKALRAGVAIAAGIALLAGAGGTFARWFDSQTVSTGEITSGELVLGEASDISWTEATLGELSLEELAAYRMVPGDEVTYSATVTPTIVGDNLVASLTADLPTATGGLAEWVVVEASVLGGGADLTEEDSGEPVEVQVVVSLPFSVGGEPGAGNGTDGQDAVLDLSDLTMSLVQNDRP